MNSILNYVGLSIDNIGIMELINKLTHQCNDNELMEIKSCLVSQYT